MGGPSRKEIAVGRQKCQNPSIWHPISLRDVIKQGGPAFLKMHFREKITKNGNITLKKTIKNGNGLGEKKMFF